MTEKIFNACSTMKNWTSYVPNTVSSRGHEGWRGLKFGKNLSPIPSSLSEYGIEFFVIFTKDVSSVSPRVDLVQQQE